VNSAGGVHGRKIRLVIRDDHYEPEPAVSNTNTLITRDHVLFLFGYVGTPTLTRVLPLLRFYEGDEIVNVGPMTGADPQRRPPYSRYVFNIRASYREEAEALVDYLYARGCRRFGFFGQADAYGKSGEVDVASALSRYRLSIVESVWYRRGGMFQEPSAMKTQLAALRSSQADAVIAFGVYGACARFIGDARIARWPVPIANVSFVDYDILFSVLKKESRTVGIDLTENLVNSEVTPSPEESLSRMAAEFRAHVPAAKRSYVAFEGWLNAAVAVEALRRCANASSRTDFWRAIQSIHDWDPGLGVKLAFDSDAHQGLHAVWVVASRDGEWVLVGQLRNGRYEEHPR
jgi:branched-chain amino acid transport system substrate-binding protein